MRHETGEILSAKPMPSRSGLPAASLTGIRIERRAPASLPAEKRGDITQKLGPAAMASVAEPIREPIADAIAELITELAADPIPEPTAEAIPEPVVAVAPEPPSTAPPSEPVDWVAAATTSAAVRLEPGEDIVAYWRRLRGEREFAAPDDLDTPAIAAFWPDSLLLAYLPASLDAGTPALAKVTRLGGETGSGAAPSAIDYTPTLTEWVLALGREAVSSGEAIEEVTRFPSDDGMTPLRVVALPLSAAQDDPDHVLCHICRARSAPFFGRRRTRLAA